VSADLWMGIAIGGTAPWVLMLCLLRSKAKQTDEQLARASAPTELLRVRNEIGLRQVLAIERIADAAEEAIKI
jgi:hypothetical protein